MYIHPKETTDQVEWNEDSRDGCDLAKYLVGTVICLDRVHGELCEIIGVRPRQHFLEVRQIAHHGNNVIYNHTPISLVHLGVKKGNNDGP